MKTIIAQEIDQVCTSTGDEGSPNFSRYMDGIKNVVNLETCTHNSTFLSDSNGIEIQNILQNEGTEFNPGFLSNIHRGSTQYLGLPLNTIKK